MKLSVIIPTVGRESLQAALSSCADADEVIVVENQDGDHGYSARTRGMAQATGTYLAFMDDDDVYTPGAIDLMRQHATDVPVIFRMDHYSHGILWKDREVRFGNVSTQMFLVPNIPDKLGVWAPHAPGLKEPGGDFTFIDGCVEKMGEPVWREEIISVLRPHDRPPSISIVTPWWNHPEFAPDYLTAVSVRNGRDELVVIDNGSDTPIGLPGIRVEQNLGFSGACNLGLHNAACDAVLWLNNDVVMTDRGWLEAIRGALEPGVLVGANLRYDRHGDVDGMSLPYLDGWCLAGMRDDLLELGGFDEGFEEPSYFGDNDLCLRARAAGMVLREVRVGLRHLVNGTTDDDIAARVAASTANRERFQARARDLLGVTV